MVKGKNIQSHTKPTDSAPITRQGYRTGRLAEDFWATTNIPNTPPSPRKTLQVIPLFIKHEGENAEYLANNKAVQLQPIAQVHVAEILAGIPWTESRARQHVVNEVAQALHKIFVFTNKIVNPFKKWKQGRWFAYWEEEIEGDHTCTLHVTIQVQENKLKPRKGQDLTWRKIHPVLWESIRTHTEESIADGTDHKSHWTQLWNCSNSVAPESPAESTHWYKPERCSSRQ